MSENKNLDEDKIFEFYVGKNPTEKQKKIIDWIKSNFAIEKCDCGDEFCRGWKFSYKRSIITMIKVILILTIISTLWNH